MITHFEIAATLQNVELLQLCCILKAMWQTYTKILGHWLFRGDAGLCDRGLKNQTDF